MDFFNGCQSGDLITVLNTIEIIRESDISKRDIEITIIAEGFRRACANNHWNIAICLLKWCNFKSIYDEGDPDDNLNTGYHKACIAGHYQMVDYLLEYDSADAFVYFNNDQELSAFQMSFRHPNITFRILSCYMNNFRIDAYKKLTKMILNTQDDNFIRCILSVKLDYICSFELEQLAIAHKWNLVILAQKNGWISQENLCDLVIQFGTLDDLKFVISQCYSTLIFVHTFFSAITYEKLELLQYIVDTYPTKLIKCFVIGIEDSTHRQTPQIFNFLVKKFTNMTMKHYLAILAYAPVEFYIYLVQDLENRNATYKEDIYFDIFGRCVKKNEVDICEFVYKFLSLEHKELFASILLDTIDYEYYLDLKIYEILLSEIPENDPSRIDFLNYFSSGFRSWKFQQYQFWKNHSSSEFIMSNSELFLGLCRIESNTSIIEDWIKDYPQMLYAMAGGYSVINRIVIHYMMNAAAKFYEMGIFPIEVYTCMRTRNLPLI